MYIDCETNDFKCVFKNRILYEKNGCEVGILRVVEI